MSVNRDVRITSICCLIAWAMAGTKLRGLRSRSSHKTSANCSGVISDSFLFQVNVSLSFWPSISMSSRIGTRTSFWDAFSRIVHGSVSSKHRGKLRTLNTLTKDSQKKKNYIYMLLIRREIQSLSLKMIFVLDHSQNHCDCEIICCKILKQLWGRTLKISPKKN